MTPAAFTGQLLAFIARLITGAQGHWKGCPPQAEQRIYIANHQSHFDLVLIWAAFPHELRAQTRAIAARDYWTKSPFRRWLTTEVFNAIYVSRTRANPTKTRWSRWSRPWPMATRWSSFPRARAPTKATRSPSRVASTTWPSSSRACR